MNPSPYPSWMDDDLEERLLERSRQIREMSAPLGKRALERTEGSAGERPRTAASASVKLDVQTRRSASLVESWLRLTIDLRFAALRST